MFDVMTATEIRHEVMNLRTSADWRYVLNMMDVLDAEAEMSFNMGEISMNEAMELVVYMDETLELYGRPE